MKKLFKLVPIALLGFCLVFNSCSDDSVIDELSDNNLRDNLSQEIILPNYETRTQKLNNLASLAESINLSYSGLENVDNAFNKKNLTLETDIAKSAKEILDDLSLSESYLIQEVQPQDNDLSDFYLLVGIGLGSLHSNTQTEGDVWRCLGSAIGLDAFAAFVEASFHLYAGEVAAGTAVDAAAAAAFRKAGVKAAKAAITKFAGGFVGAMVIVGSFVMCMAQ